MRERGVNQGKVSSTVTNKNSIIFFMILTLIFPNSQIESHDFLTFNTPLVTIHEILYKYCYKCCIGLYRLQNLRKTYGVVLKYSTTSITWTVLDCDFGYGEVTDPDNWKPIVFYSIPASFNFLKHVNIFLTIKKVTTIILSSTITALLTITK